MNRHSLFSAFTAASIFHIASAVAAAPATPAVTTITANGATANANFSNGTQSGFIIVNEFGGPSGPQLNLFLLLNEGCTEPAQNIQRCVSSFWSGTVGRSSFNITTATAHFNADSSDLTVTQEVSECNTETSECVFSTVTPNENRQVSIYWKKILGFRASGNSTRNNEFGLFTTKTTESFSNVYAQVVATFSGFDSQFLGTGTLGTTRNTTIEIVHKQ